MFLYDACMRFVLFALALGSAACASGPSATPDNASPQAAGGAKPRKVCKEEATTGSNISHIVCRTPEEAERDREGAQKWSVAPARNPTMPTSK